MRISTSSSLVRSHRGDSTTVRVTLEWLLLALRLDQIESDVFHLYDHLLLASKLNNFKKIQEKLAGHSRQNEHFPS